MTRALHRIRAVPAAAATRLSIRHLKGGPITDEYTAGLELGLPHNFQVRFNAVHKLDTAGTRRLTWTTV